MDHSHFRNTLNLELRSLEFTPLSKPFMGLDDTLARARRLDSSTLADIHDRYYPEVYRYVRYRLSDEQITEDISSEVFLRLLDALHQGRGPTQSLRGWLFGTASNLVNDHLRKRYSRPIENIDPSERHPANEDTPENSYQDAWEHGRVRKAMLELTSDQQHVLALRFANDYSLNETAQAIGKSISAVKALQFRAIASLRRLLQEDIK
jgi:RNA polymerase sigma-70 factor (ECF subfamily)